MTTTPTTVSSSYDQADRLTNAGYGYDTLGRTTSVPQVDAVGVGPAASAWGSVVVGYYSNDLVASQVQGSSTVTFAPGPLRGRVLSQNGPGNRAYTNHYDAGGDCPAWNRFLRGSDGGLAAVATQANGVTLELANLHGDIVATAATGVGSYSESTEYGAPRSAVSAFSPYGWLGAKQRSDLDLGGLILMGVRLYNPATGRFLTVDPVPGGNANAYTYPENPLDQFDLTGQFSWKSVTKFVGKNWKVGVHFAVGMAVTAGAVAAAGALCMTGVGCIAVAASLSLLYGTAAQLGTAAVLHEHVTAPKVLEWMGSSASAGARKAYFMARFGAGPLKLAWRAVRR
jgi:RHS repeat-associated protein